MKLIDKICKVGDNFTVTFFDNGYMIEVGGKGISDDWATAKIVANNRDELLSLINEALKLPRDN